MYQDGQGSRGLYPKRVTFLVTYQDRRTAGTSLGVNYVIISVLQNKFTLHAPAPQKQRVDVSSSKIPAKTTHPGYANPAVLLREPPVRQAASRSVPPSPLMAPIPATTSPAPVSYRTSPLPIQQAIIREAQAVTSALRRTEELQDQLQRESTETQARLAVVQREEEKRVRPLPL